MSESDRRLGDLLLYVTGRLRDEPAAGSTKVNKLLYFAEQAHVRAHGVPITGAEYQRLEHGPAPRRLKPVRDALVANGDAEVIEETILGRLQHRLVPKRPPRFDVFTNDQVAAVDEVLERFGGHTGTQLTAASHEDAGWRMVAEGETIPLETAFLDLEQRPAWALARARELAEQHDHLAG